ncbi:uncharacterized protein LOC126818746 [Patella vulgata]|uniref:uncharacterized protein LOC126818746 n=1 Tax=Patella vulgata TaxID=6465 RepID=UPI00217F3691|nr:uncharacterized protein LOC126818746 [Patella vulgata]
MNSSLTDESIGDDLSTTEAIVTYKVVDNGTERGKRKLVSSDGHTFTMKRQNKGSTEWRCSIRNKTTLCPVIIKERVGTYNANTEHSHAAKPGILTAVKIQAELKVKAPMTLFEPAQNIVDNILAEHVDNREPEASIQAVWRKIQENGLQTAYSQKDAVYKFFRKVLALPFLPAEHILPTFNKLEEKATTDQIKVVMKYIMDNWLTSNIWTIPTWSVFGRTIRTNNDVEGWHNRINQKARKGNLQFYLLISLLYKEAAQLPTQMKMVSEGKLRRHQKKQSRTTQSKLFQLWNLYTSQEISTNQLLKRCGGIYGPN